MGKNKKKQNISKKEKQLQQYQKHQCQTNDDDFHRQHMQNQQQGGQDDIFNSLAEQIKHIDPDAPLPDFTEFETNQVLVKNIMQDINQTVEKIKNNQIDEFRENEQKQEQKTSQLNKEMRQKRDLYVKEIKNKMNFQQKQQKDILQLAEKDEDISDILKSISLNLQFDIEKNEDLCKILNEQ